MSLSSGERQLSPSPARSSPRPRVLVLDEATSNLDLKSETQVEAGLDAVLEGRTAIIVAHRLSTAMRADRIAVVDDGRIVELGLARRARGHAGGRYAEMYAAWTAHLETEPDAPEVVAHQPEPGRFGGPRRVTSGGSSAHGQARSRSSTTSSSATTTRTSRRNECTECGALFFDRRNACAHCGKTARSARRRLGTTGVVRSFAIVHQAAPGVPVPYVSSVVDLDGGGDVKANVVNIEPEPEHVSLGMKVQLTTFVAGTDDEGTEAVVFGFEPRLSQLEIQREKGLSHG